MSEAEVRKFILEFDSVFPLDREYRKKYEIPFGSEQHLNTCQIDIYMEYIEDKIYDEFFEEAKIKYQEEKDFKEGKIIKEKKPTKEEDDALWNKLKEIDFSNVNMSIVD
jgi:hypothetical protein